ncbi:NAD(P)/FAD-dependent oxidoreductase [Micromonospora sp. NPDC052213]|uniref:NAD(P)/FAD-dependent oxidoreductase n=1 Tax=Micromonospora sp. NPDC052213 TaxID=3155812 RepID=UPI003431F2A5
MSHPEPEYDVIVVGGGPAGSSTAGLLAQEGHRVLLLEREKFPRYHIGESLISGVTLTLDALGVRERMAELRFQIKHGGSLLWGADQTAPWSFRFREIRDARFDYSWQVRRAEFDAMLLDRARELGVVVVEGATVRGPLTDGDRIAGVSYQFRGEADPIDARAAIVVDASGQQRWLGRHFGLVSWHDDLRNMATWSYYAGALRYPGDHEGDLLVESRSHGWLWYAPLSPTLTGIGYVTPSDRFVESGLPPEQLLEKQIAESNEVSWLTSGARRVDVYRTARDWSYACSQFSGPGWVLVGDAAAFIDPLLSSGVTLAMRGALSLSRAVHEALAAPEKERHLMQVYEDRYRDFLAALIDLIRFFYDGAHGRDELHLRAQTIVDPDRLMPPKISFVSLLSGLARGDETLDIAPRTAIDRPSGAI